MDIISEETCAQVSKTLFYDMPDMQLVQHIIRGQFTSSPDYSSTKEEIRELLQKEEDVKEYEPDIEMHEPTQLSQCETVPMFDQLFEAFK